MKVFTTIVLCTLLLAGCGAPGPAPDRDLIKIQPAKAVIFDTDMAHEDMIAALFLLSHPNADLRAITVSGTGEAHCGPGVRNALGLVKLSGHREIPVACGREMPLGGKHEFPAQWRQAADEAYGVQLPEGGAASSLGAAEVIIEAVQRMEQPITIVAVGPLTNIAEAIQDEPGIVEGIREIYIMGGAINVEGNVGDSGVGIQNQHAEWNIYIDPAAANIVFRAGIPITLVPLDATRDVPVTRDFYRALEKNRGTASAGLVYEILGANLDFVDSGGFQFWDSLTAAMSMDQSIATLKEMKLTVVEEEGAESGRTMSTPDGSTIRVAMSAERKSFEQTVLTVLNWRKD